MQQDLKSNNLFLNEAFNMLRIVHSRDWCTDLHLDRLVLCTPSGACHKRRRAGVPKSAALN